MSDLPLSPATPFWQLFILDTDSYESETALYRSMDDLILGMIELVAAPGDSMFSDVAGDIRALLAEHSSSQSRARHEDLLNEMRQILEDSHYVTFIHRVTLPQ